MSRKLRKCCSHITDVFGHCSNRICSLLWFAGVCCHPVGTDFHPESAFMRHLNLSICWFQIHDPIFLMYPVKSDSAFYAIHITFLVNRTDKSNRALQSDCSLLYSLCCFFKYCKCAGQTGLHITGTTTIDSSLFLFRPKRISIPALSGYHRIHMADENQSGNLRSKLFCFNLSYKIIPFIRHLVFCYYDSRNR